MLIDALFNIFQIDLLSFLKTNMANYCIYIFSRNYPLNDIQLDECRKQVFGSKQSFPHSLFTTQFLFSILYTSTDTSTAKSNFCSALPARAARLPKFTPLIVQQIQAMYGLANLHRLSTCIQAQCQRHGRYMLCNNFKCLRKITRCSSSFVYFDNKR